MMKDQRDLIHQVDWDNLIVLDACRFDYFRDVYSNYLEGDLRKVSSNSTCTGEWLSRTFQDKYQDIVYISAMPHINSEGLALKNTHKVWEYDWKATEHFGSIIDVWDFGWSDRIGTVPPEAMVGTVESLDSERKKIIHFVQPHGPYISLTENHRLDKAWYVKKEEEKSTLTKLKEVVGGIIKKASGRETVWRLKTLLGMNHPPGSIAHAWRKGSISPYYRDNLIRVLESVVDLLEVVDGAVVVTSDHGELLGENGEYFHSVESNSPLLREVPWLEVET